jgi:hypothetical protein
MIFTNYCFLVDIATSCRVRLVILPFILIFGLVCLTLLSTNNQDVYDVDMTNWIQFTFRTDSIYALRYTISKK